jgi:hypothetical protein
MSILSIAMPESVPRELGRGSDDCAKENDESGFSGLERGFRKDVVDGNPNQRGKQQDNVDGGHCSFHGVSVSLVQATFSSSVADGINWAVAS